MAVLYDLWHSVKGVSCHGTTEAWNRIPRAVSCAGMEAAVANLLEPDETILVGNNGIWGTRVADMAGRFRGEAPADQIGPDQIR